MPLIIVKFGRVGESGDTLPVVVTLYIRPSMTDCHDAFRPLPLVYSLFAALSMSHATSRETQIDSSAR